VVEIRKEGVWEKKSAQEVDISTRLIGFKGSIRTQEAYDKGTVKVLSHRSLRKRAVKRQKGTRMALSFTLWSRGQRKLQKGEKTMEGNEGKEGGGPKP